MTETSFKKGKIKILLLEGVHPSALKVLQSAGYSNIEYYNSPLAVKELEKAIKNVHLIGIRSRTQLTENIFQKAQKLIVVGCFCIGTNQVDLAAAAKCGIPVFNAPFSNTRSVAELVLGEILLLLRDIPAKNAAVHRGDWIKSVDRSFEARGKSLGIIGYGHIGTQLGILAENLGMHVFYYDIKNKLSLGNATQVASMSNLLNKSDIITLHVPETNLTQNIIGKEEFACMKFGAIFINAARGTAVNIDALCAALESGHISGAAVDVFPAEPKTNNDPFLSPLQAFDNVILTPHIGGSTHEAQKNIGIEVIGKMIKYSDNGSTLSCVNLPEVSLPEHLGTSRLLHIHENRFGILTKINTIFAEEGINIVGQYLQTNVEYGYVVIDVETKYAGTASKKLKAIEGTLRSRILH
ncbi:phosphoglycerate dehydrogenase [Candidatus Enterovibrio altilux]|nr:phosphoglycerate dehydrogenase [Candidatus Enterovibrio luxaltus]